MKFKIVISGFEKVPKWYGISMVNFEQRKAICYPLGIHAIIALSYRLYCFLAYKIYSCYVPIKVHEKAVADAYSKGGLFHMKFEKCSCNAPTDFVDWHIITCTKCSASWIE